MARPDDEQPALADWARTLQRRVRQRGINAFILHGPGVRDIHALGTRRRGTITVLQARIQSCHPLVDSATDLWLCSRAQMLLLIARLCTTSQKGRL